MRVTRDNDLSVGVQAELSAVRSDNELLRRRVATLEEEIKSLRGVLLTVKRTVNMGVEPHHP